jgi:hypothetical protein
VPSLDDGRAVVRPQMRAELRSGDWQTADRASLLDARPDDSAAEIGSGVPASGAHPAVRGGDRSGSAPECGCGRGSGFGCAERRRSERARAGRTRMSRSLPWKLPPGSSSDRCDGGGGRSPVATTDHHRSGSVLALSMTMGTLANYGRRSRFSLPPWSQFDSDQGPRSPFTHLVVGVYHRDSPVP